MAAPDDEAFLKKYGNYKPASTNVPVTTIKPILGGETPEEAAARRADEERRAAAEARASSAEARAQAAAQREATRFQQEQAAGGGAKPTEAQQKTLTLLTRIAGGASDIQKTLALDPEAQQAGLFETLSRNVLGEGVVTRGIAGPERRMVTDAQADILDALLTLGTGAAYSREQLIGQTVSYFPQYGDTQAEIAAKNDRLKRLTEAARIQAGPLADKFDEVIKPLLGGAPAEAPKVDAQGREIVAPELRVAEGAEYSTDADFQRQRDAAEAWAATQGLPFDQALSQFNAAMQSKGYAAADPQTINVLQWYEQNRPGNRGAVEWALPKSGLRASEAPGRIAALGSGLLTGGTAGLAEEAVGLFDPEAAAKLEAAKRYARENYAGTELLGEVIGGFATPLSRIGRGGTIAGEATRGAVYGGLMGAGEPAAGADLTERLTGGVIGAGLGGAIGGAAQRVLGGGLPRAVEISPAGGAPEMPAGVIAPEAPPVAAVAPEVAPAAPAGMAEEVVIEAATMTPQEIGDLARKAVGRGPGSAKAKSQLATLAKSNPEAVAAADRLGLELPVDVLSDNAQLRSLTGLARSEVGSEAETAWGETARSVIQRANQAMDELGATTDLTQVSADVFKRVDDAQKSLGNQASLLREEVEATFNTTDRVEPTRIREWLQSRIDELGGGKEGLAALSPEEKKLWGVVSKGQPTYARLNEARDMIGQALNKGTGPWADANLSRVKQLYGALADDQINFIEATAGKEIADKQRAANTLFQEMFKNREQMQDIFGKDLSKSLVPLMQRAITSGSKGDISALNQLVSSVPEDMRGMVLTSALFNAAKTRSGARGAEEMFSFTNFSKIYRDLRNNKEVYKQIAKAVGPDGDRLLTDLYAISRRMADAESKVLKTGKANQALDNSLNAERLLNRVLKGAGARLGAATVGGVAAGPVGVAVAGGLTEGAQYIAQGMGKKNADKVHALLSSEQFRNLIDNVGSGGNVDQAINRVASSRPFIDYLKSIGVEAKQGKNWLRSAFTVAPVSGVTRQAESQQPVAAPPMAAQQ